MTMEAQNAGQAGTQNIPLSLLTVIVPGTVIPISDKLAQSYVSRAVW
jgi:hypothetical protein